MKEIEDALSLLETIRQKIRERSVKRDYPLFVYEDALDLAAMHIRAIQTMLSNSEP